MPGQSEKRTILMTTALYYANGEIHLGHLVEAIQADIWARFQRLQGHHVLFVGGDDAHGTPIMLTAYKKGITPEELIKKVYKNHQEIFKAFSISFDNFYTTHSPENKSLLYLIYDRLKKNDDITTRTITQAYDPEKKIFLADRYIKGECPRCGAKDQNGDNCEVCGSTYDPKDLINPVSILSGVAPIEKETLHYFFKLEKYTDLLKEWIHSGKIQSQVAHKLNEWFEQGLKQWDISRDAPYFGFKIPDDPDKYFYVWLDAPIGYMASFKNFTDKNPEINFDDYWKKDSPVELYHFVGKDIVYFHALFWPAMLHGANFRLPNGIFVHGFLTINGEKMSKSRETFITGTNYLKHLNPEFLRYYLAGKLNAQVEDIDINFTDFIFRVNSDLVGKYVNLASRCAGFITKKFEGKLGENLPDQSLYDEFIQHAETIASCFEKLNYNRATREIMALADRANQYIDAKKPWALAKEAGKEKEVQAICSQGINLFRLLTIFLKPILPETAKKVEAFLNIAPLTWADLKTPLLNHKINTFHPLLQRITEDDVNKLL